MMIKLTREEIWLINSTNTSIQSVQQELRQLEAAQSSLIQLLEGKYDAVYSPEKGLFEPKSVEEEPKKGKKR